MWNRYRIAVHWLLWTLRLTSLRMRRMTRPLCKKCKRLPILVTERYGPQLIPVFRQSARRWYKSPGGRLSLLSARPAVTFPAAEHHRPSAGTKLYCLVTEAHWTTCPRLLRSFCPSRIWTHDLLIASPVVYPLRHLCVGGNISHVCNMPDPYLFIIKTKTGFSFSSL